MLIPPIPALKSAILCIIFDHGFVANAWYNPKVLYRITYPSTIFPFKSLHVVSGADAAQEAPNSVIPLGKKHSLTAGMGLKPRSNPAQPVRSSEHNVQGLARVKRLETELQQEFKLRVCSWCLG